jgi:hypothetical protein
MDFNITSFNWYRLNVHIRTTPQHPMTMGSPPCCTFHKKGELMIFQDEKPGPIPARETDEMQSFHQRSHWKGQGIYQCGCGIHGMICW